MSKIVFKAIAFMFIFNISVGIMMTALPNVFTQDKTSGLIYFQNQSGVFVDGMQHTITPTGELENAGDQVYRLLDLTIIGFLENALSIIRKYLYGFVQMLDIIFGGAIATENLPLRNFLFHPVYGVFYVMTTISYIYGVFYLWTSKNLTKSD